MKKSYQEERKNPYWGILREQRSVDTIFELSLWLTPAHWYLPEWSLYPCVLFFLQLLSGDTGTLSSSSAQLGLHL